MNIKHFIFILFYCILHQISYPHTTRPQVRCITQRRSCRLHLICYFLAMFLFHFAYKSLFVSIATMKSDCFLDGLPRRMLDKFTHWERTFKIFALIRIWSDFFIRSFEYFIIYCWYYHIFCIIKTVSHVNYILSHFYHKNW